MKELSFCRQVWFLQRLFSTSQNSVTPDVFPGNCRGHRCHFDADSMA